MDCNKANIFMMDYMDLNISEEDNFLLEKHLEKCEECRENFELYTKILEDFSLDNIDIVEAPEDLKINVMEKIEHIEPIYIKEKNRKNILVYVFLGMTSLMFSLFLIVSLNKDAFLLDIEKSPILYTYYSFFDSIFNTSLETLNLVNIIKGIYNIFPYLIEGLKYTSIILIICIIAAQYFLNKRESLKI